MTVEAEADTSIASQMAPMKALLDMDSPRTEISSQYVRQYTSPMTDFADILQAAPGIVTCATNGVGNGESKVRFRAFADGAFTMTWDGVPCQDSNDPTHHSWAYVPAPAISYVDFDRSPGTASDVGPTNFGGSIHMFSPKMGDAMSFKLSESYGSFNTNQILGVFDSGLFRQQPRLTSGLRGTTTAPTATRPSTTSSAPRSPQSSTTSSPTRLYLTLISTIVVVDSNTPDSDPTRQQIADHGLNYMRTATMLNPDGTYNSHVLSELHLPRADRLRNHHLRYEFGHGWRFETKPYSYSYSNHQHLRTTRLRISPHEVAWSVPPAGETS